MNSIKIISSVLFFLPTLLVFGQDTITPALAPKQIKPYNRAFEILHEQYRGNPIIRIKGKPDAGIAWIEGDNDWPYLRETYPQKYEASVPSTVDPNEWFHVKLIIGQQTIAVFINSYPQPILSVKSLMSNGKGKVGFWTGNGSDGDFSGLVVIKH